MLQTEPSPVVDALRLLRRKLNDYDQDHFRLNGDPVTEYQQRQVAARLYKYAKLLPTEIGQEIIALATEHKESLANGERHPLIVKGDAKYFLVRHVDRSNKDLVKAAAERIVGKRCLLWNLPEFPNSWAVPAKFVGMLANSGEFDLDEGITESDLKAFKPSSAPQAPPIDWSALTPMRTPRPFQKEGVEFLVPALVEPGKGALLADDQGLGKTTQSLMTGMTYGEKLAVVCPAGVRYNWVNEIFLTHPTWTVCVLFDKARSRTLKSSFGANASRIVARPDAADVIVMGYETTRQIICGNPDPHTACYNTMKYVVLPAWADLFKERILICDECFPYETAVITDKGVMPIGYLVENKVACRVLSVDSLHNELCWRPVTAHYTKDNHERFVTIAHKQGTLRCTDNHPIWVEGKGYVRADCIEAGDRVRVVRVSDHQGPILQHELLGQVAHEPPAHQGYSARERSQSGAYEQRPQAPRLQQADDAAQPDGMRSYQREDAEDDDRPTVPRNSWRQWKADSPSSDAVRGAEPRSLLGVSDQHEGREVAQQTPDMLQVGSSFPASPRSNRGRWAVAHAPSYEGLGPQENLCVESVRVESVTVDQLGDNERSEGSRSKGEKVYCLEVEGTNNFFANGVLVHNCHYGKNTKAKRTQSVLAVARASKRVLAMTGTPICNRPAELWPILCAIGRDREIAGSAADFKQSYVEQRNLEELHRRLAAGGWFIRRLKKDVLTELPPKQRQDLLVEMSPRQQLEYESLRQGLKTQVKNGGMASNGTCILALLTALQTKANEAKVEPIVEMLQERADEGYFTVVSCERTEPLFKIRDELAAQGVTVELLYGGSGNAEKKRICTDFADGKIQVVLTTLAEGINLQKADCNILLDLPWSPGKVAQKEDRCLIGKSLVPCLRSDRVGGMSLTYIEDVQIGDSVLTHAGRWRTVQDIAARNHRGMMTSIEYVGWYEPLVCTHDHKLYVRRNSTMQWLPACEVLPSDSMAFPIPQKRTPLTTVDTRKWACHLRATAATGCSVAGCEQTIEARGMCRVHYRNALRVGQTLPKARTGIGRYKGLPNEITVDSRWLYLFGNYLAEGFASCQKDKGHFISISGHERELPRLQEFVRLFAEYGWTATIYHSRTSKGIELRCFNGELAAWFLEWFGHGAANKHIPTVLQDLPQEQARVFLKGYTDGDGYRRKNHQEWVSVSGTLCYQMCMVAVCAGYVPCMRRVDPKERPAIRHTRAQYVGSYCVEPPAGSRDKEYVYRNVRSVATYKDKVKVYDITVDKDHSFATGFATAHNCHRIGQTAKVLIVRVLAASIDHHKKTVIADKADIIDIAINGGDSPHADDECLAEVIRRLVDED